MEQDPDEGWCWARSEHTRCAGKGCEGCGWVGSELVRLPANFRSRAYRPIVTEWAHRSYL